jgi:predicted nucleic acid-binding protein
MGLKYLWDTNTVVYYLQQHFSIHAEKFMDSVLQEFQPALSIITEIELLSWPSATERDIAVLNDFITDCFVLELDKNIKDKAVEIRKSFKVKLPDAIIAATALTNNLVLISRNTSDFKKIPNLELIDPFLIPE